MDLETNFIGFIVALEAKISDFWSNIETFYHLTTSTVQDTQYYESVEKHDFYGSIDCLKAWERLERSLRMRQLAWVAHSLMSFSGF